MSQHEASLMRNWVLKMFYTKYLMQKQGNVFSSKEKLILTRAYNILEEGDNQER